MQDPTKTPVYQDCLRLYIEYGGRNIARIERELRSLGHRFHRRSLYQRNQNPGWILKYRWQDLLSVPPAVAGGSPPFPAAVRNELPASAGNAGALACMSDSERNVVHRLHTPASENEKQISRKAAKTQSGDRSSVERPRVSNGCRNCQSPRVSKGDTGILVRTACGNRWADAQGQPDTRTQIRQTTADQKPNCESPRVSKGDTATLTENQSCMGGVTTSDVSPSLTVGLSHEPADFPAWLRSVSPTMNWNWPHHRAIYRQLERFTRGETKRLMIFVPPRHGKSELVTVRYTAWRIKRDPSLNVIVAGYGQRLADRFSRKIRSVLSDAASQANASAGNAGIPAGKCVNTGQFKQDGQDKGKGPTNSSHTHQPTSKNFDPKCPCCSPQANRRINSVAEWETHAGGGVRAVGVGGAVTGFGAGLIIIDDPIKSRQQAESKTYRDRTWDWYNDDISTRLEPGGGIILIQTRWHEDDLAGRLLRDAEDGGEKWDVISLPAIAEGKGGRMKDEGKSEDPRSERPTVREGEPLVRTACGNRWADAQDQTNPRTQIRQIETDHIIKCESPRVSKGDTSTQAEESSRQAAKTQSEDQSPVGGPRVSKGFRQYGSTYENGSINRDGGAVRSGHPEIDSGDGGNSTLLVSPSLTVGLPHSTVGLPHTFDPLGRRPGDALCPERFDREALEKVRRQLGTYSFSALYQQRPTPPEGGLFKRHWFSRIVAAPPPELDWARGYDLAVSQKTTADYTASFRCAFAKNGDLYIDGGFRARIEYPDQRRYILERFIAEPGTRHGIETALHGEAFIQDLRREPASRGRMLEGVKVGTDKMTRALTWSPLAEDGKVVLVRGAWNTDFIDEACSFPYGEHDDQIDAVSVAVQLLSRKQHISGGV